MSNPLAGCIVVGDSEGSHNSLINNTIDRAVNSRVWQYSRGLNSVRAGIEPLDNLGIGGNQNTWTIGSSLAAIKLIQPLFNQQVSGFDLCAIACIEEGEGLTSSNGYWNVKDGTTPRQGLDTIPGGLGGGLYQQVTEFLALDSRNFIFCATWDFWGNDNSNQATFEAAAILFWNEIRSRIPTASRIPVFCTGIAPNRAAIGGDNTHLGVLAALQDLPNQLDGFQFIDTSDLNISPCNNNGWLHWGAEDARGGYRLGSTLPAAWSSGTTYNYYDVAVGSDFNFYRSKVNSNLGNDPTTDPPGGVPNSSEGTNWVKISQQGTSPLWVPPLWSSTLSYAPSTNCVISPTDGFVYQCTSSIGTGGSDPHTDALSGTPHWVKTNAFATANITNPISQRKYVCYQNARWKIRAHWNTAPTPGTVSDLAVVTNATTTSSLSFYHTPATNAPRHEYRIRTPSGSGTFGAATDLVQGTITGLTTATNYGIQVRGKTVAGAVGAWSNEASGTTN